MRTTVIEKGDILADHPSGMTLTEDQEMVQVFAANRADETLNTALAFGAWKGVWSSSV